MVEAALLTSLAAGVNVMLLFGLLSIYVQNCRQIRSKFTTGLLVFAIVFLLLNAATIYFNMTIQMYNSAEAELLALVLSATQTVGLATLLWVSWE